MRLIVELSGDRDRMGQRLAATQRLIEQRPDLSLSIFVPVESEPKGNKILQGNDLTVSRQTIKEGLESLAESEEEAVFVSAGNTSRIVLQSVRNVGIIYPGLQPILAVEMPKIKGRYLLVDGGGSLWPDPKLLAWCALAGKIEAQVRLGRESPRIGLMNVGEEPSKGGKRMQEIRIYLEELLGELFIGNVEPQNVSGMDIDVLVTAGFSGNLVLKATEGAYDMLNQKVKLCCHKNPLLWPLSWLLKGLTKIFWKDFNWRDYAAFALLGLKKPVFVAHGRSDEKSFYTALTKAVSPLTFEIWHKTEKDPQIRALFNS